MGSHLCMEARPVTAPPEPRFWCCTTRDNIRQVLQRVNVPAPTPGAAPAGGEGGAWRGATTGSYRAWEAPRICKTPSLHVSPQALRLLSPSLHPDCSFIGPSQCGLVSRDTCGKKASKGSFDIGTLYSLGHYTVALVCAGTANPASGPRASSPRRRAASWACSPPGPGGASSPWQRASGRPACLVPGLACTHHGEG
ncbi:uncharacterized protein LOC143668555 [Tamandua tetradactyla]|uniref:uncharacterized protein LOC143668555 n=1 Tax=Tamandua tetradactyla TaxID=48850 RepID=UPI004053BA15